MRWVQIIGLILQGSVFTLSKKMWHYMSKQKCHDGSLDRPWKKGKWGSAPAFWKKGSCLFILYWDFQIMELALFWWMHLSMPTNQQPYVSTSDINSLMSVKASQSRPLYILKSLYKIRSLLIWEWLYLMNLTSYLRFQKNSIWCACCCLSVIYFQYCVMVS